MNRAYVHAAERCGRGLVRVLRSLLEAEKMDQDQRLAHVHWQSLNRVENLFPEKPVFGIAANALKVGKPGQHLIVEFPLDQFNLVGGFG